MKDAHPSRRIAIIGGGISGVTAAYELSVRHPQHVVTLYEASSRLGGIIETVTEQGFTIECGPDSWVTEKPWARELAEELGLADEIIPSQDHQRRTYILRDRQLVPMPDGMRMMVPTQWEPLLHSPLLSWQAKLAYLRENKRAGELKASALAERGSSADEPISDFVLRHFGAEVSDTLAGPLLSGVFGGDIAKLSLRAVMAPFVRMEAEHGSLIDALRMLGSPSPGKLKPAIFTTLRSGLETLITRMVEKIPPSSIRLATKVNALKPLRHGWNVSTAAGDDFEFDEVILATPSRGTSLLLHASGLAVAQEVASLLPAEASSALVVALGYGQEKAARLRIPRGFGFLVPQFSKDPGATSLLACTFVDQKFNDRVPPDSVLLRGFFGGVAAERLAGESDATLGQLTRDQLSRILGPLPEADLTVVRHWPMSLPQYFVGHVARMARLDELMRTLPGLNVIGNAYRGVGLPDLVREARSLVNRLQVPAGWHA